MENVYKISVGKCDWKDNLRNPGIDGRITLKWLLKKKHDRIHWIHLAKNTI